MKKTLISSLLLTLAIAGCSSQDDDITTFIKNPGVSPRNIEKLPTAKTFPSVEYNRNLVRDPFVPKLMISNLTDDSPFKNVEKQPLEYFPLDTLVMIGLLNIDGVTYALIRDPEIQVHRITLGNRMGQNFGKVVQISKNGIQLKETVQDNNGSWIEVDSTLSYQEADNVTNVGSNRRSQK